MKVSKEIKEFTNKNGYESVEYLGKYKKYNVYEPIYREDEELYIVGLPAFILDDNGKLEWVQDDRSFDILNYFY